MKRNDKVSFSSQSTMMKGPSNPTRPTQARAAHHQRPAMPNTHQGGSRRTVAPPPRNQSQQGESTLQYTAPRQSARQLQANYQPPPPKVLPRQGSVYGSSHSSYYDDQSKQQNQQDTVCSQRSVALTRSIGGVPLNEGFARGGKRTHYDYDIQRFENSDNLPNHGRSMAPHPNDGSLYGGQQGFCDAFAKTRGDTSQLFDGLYDRQTARGAADVVFRDDKDEGEMEVYYNNVFDEDKKDEAILDALTHQKFHLPGNTWFQDWSSYFGNNHPVLGICFHHPDHPIGTIKRVIILMGSVAFGLLMTNVFYIMFMYFSDDGIDATISVANFTSSDGGYHLVTSLEASVNSFTTYELALLLIGGPLHGFFDNLIWYLESAPYCKEGGCWETHRWFGSFFSIVAVLVIMTLASVAVLVRGLSQNVELQSLSGATRFISAVSHQEMLQHLDSSRFDFLIWWYMELAIEYFFFSFVIGTLVFSGWLSCGGRIPFMGGRPKEMKELEEKMEEEREVLGQHMMYRKREVLSKRTLT